tara:strand:+ start:94 stop:309 length:216 start_codon:yes stop_codon:yes gene_type:complete
MSNTPENTNTDERTVLENEHGKVWTTGELQQDFDVHGFMAPFVRVTRKADNAEGTLRFQHAPRFYYDFKGV